MLASTGGGLPWQGTIRLTYQNERVAKCPNRAWYVNRIVPGLAPITVATFNSAITLKEAISSSCSAADGRHSNY